MDQNQLLSANIIEELGIAALPDDKKAALLAQMIDLIQKRITLRLIDGLSEKELEEFGKIAEAQDAAKLASFAQKHGKNIEEITMEETAKLKAEMIERTKDIK